MKLTKSQNAIIDFIHHQLSIDLKPYICSRQHNRKYITIDTIEIVSTQLRQIESLAISSGRYSYELNGYRKISLKDTK